jgi:hypothetical protein
MHRANADSVGTPFPPSRARVVDDEFAENESSSGLAAVDDHGVTDRERCFV